MKTNRWQMGVNILLAVVLLAVAGFTWQLNSRHNQLSTELTQDLATTKGDLASTKGDLVATRDRLQAADAALSQDISRQGTALSADIEAARTRLQEVRTQLEAADTTLKQEISRQGTALSADIAAAKTRLQEVRTQLDAADAALSQDISRQGTALSADIAAARSLLQQVKTQLETADAALSQEVSRQGTALSADIEAERSRIQALQTQASELSSQIARALIDVVPLYANVKDSVVEVQATIGGLRYQATGFLYGTGKRYIITAHHMVDGATAIKVVTVGGVEIAASPTLVAFNRQKDIAVLQLVSPLNATPLTLGDSSKVTVGEPVLLVGSPFGERGSASAGIVSGLNREVEYDGYFVADMIQFDAASNPGSSGSPLINAKGEVIGLVTAGVDIAFGWGMSYGVPASALKELVSILPQ